MPSSDPRRSGNPATRAAAARSPKPASARAAVNGRSRALLVRMARLPTLAVPGAMLVLMLVGLTAPLPFALPALVVIVVFVGWLAYLSWPILTTRGRLLRGVLIGLMIGTIVSRIQGWL